MSRDKKLAYRWKVNISRASNVDEYVNLDEKEPATFCEILSGLVAEAQSTVRKGSDHAIDPMDQLKKLKELLELGVISQDEFNEGRNRCERSSDPQGLNAKVELESILIDALSISVFAGRTGWVETRWANGFRFL